MSKPFTLTTLQVLAAPKKLGTATMGRKPVALMGSRPTMCVGAIAMRMQNVIIPNLPASFEKNLEDEPQCLNPL